MMALAFVLALAFFVASLMPSALVAPVLAELLFYAALGGAAGALLKRQSMLGEKGMTGWDQAALLILASLVCGMFVDPEAAREALAQMTQETAGAAS